MTRALVLGLWVAGCGSAPPPEPTLVEHRVSPSATDSAITTPNRDHYAYVDPGITSNGKLFMFLPGTGQEPSQTKLILKTAAAQGFHAVAVDYPNSAAVADLCQDMLDCYLSVRQEILTGNDATSLVNVAPENSILSRATALVSYLAAKNPSEGWSPFVVSGELAYANLVISGHSQGGGHAALIAKQHSVARVVLFSSVVDGSSTTPPVAAGWLGITSDTPADRYYGFDHTLDPAATKIETGWTALGVPGTVAKIDGAAPPFGNAHKLTSSAAVLDGHNSVVVDFFTPMSAESPAYLPAWTYLLGP